MQAILLFVHFIDNEFRYIGPKPFGLSGYERMEFFGFLIVLADAFERPLANWSRAAKDVENFPKEMN